MPHQAPGVDIVLLVRRLHKLRAVLIPKLFYDLPDRHPILPRKRIDSIVRPVTKEVFSDRKVAAADNALIIRENDLGAGPKPSDFGIQVVPGLVHIRLNQDRIGVVMPDAMPAAIVSRASIA